MTTPPNMSTKTKPAASAYHKSSPVIPDGLVSLDSWAAANGLTPTCARQWIWSGKIKGFRVPGYGLKTFVDPKACAQALKPTPATPNLAR